MRLPSGTLVLLLLALTACDDGAGRAETVTLAVRYPGIRAALTLDPERLLDYTQAFRPINFTEEQLRLQDNMPASRNPTTNAGATLGRVLFYDKALSINGRASCASCHLLSVGLADTNRFSTGFDGRLNTRATAMRLLNLRFYGDGHAFWDRRAVSLEELVTEPIRDSIELGFVAAVGGVDSLLKRMRALPYYPELFTIAFGDDQVTEVRLKKALAQYLRSIVSNSSRFDFALTVSGGTLVDRLAPLSQLTPQENRGKLLFATSNSVGGANCEVCHRFPQFALDGGSKSNGLDAGETRVFKAPSLKSVALSRHFMHDGRFRTLEEVVEFYNSGIQPGPALDPRLTDGAPDRPQRLHLSSEDKAAVVAFLRTLTDALSDNDPRFGDPFRR
ncbi:MAG: cytochrome-c peroxidase [Gemmatimonadaceae bacterium]|nr:cytochrome-c peroxidase [Gemmatimonadaceae bacterium]